MDLDPAYFDKVADASLSFRGTVTDTTARVFVGFEGDFGDAVVTPRSLSAESLCRLVALEGIVTRCSLVRPKVMRSVHFCPATVRLLTMCTRVVSAAVPVRGSAHAHPRTFTAHVQKKFLTREFRDATDLSGLPTGGVYPQKDDAGNRLDTEFGLSSYKDSQTITIQEMPESSPLGQLPRSVDAYVEQDLVDKVKPGDRVCIIGIYRALTTNASQMTSGNFRTVLLANAIHRTSKETGALSFSIGDIANIRQMSSRPDMFSLLARSLAPSIYGHTFVKQALALLLLGGREHNLENGTHIRGDINILMVGDPSTAKSQVCVCVCVCVHAHTTGTCAVRMRAP